MLDIKRFAPIPVRDAHAVEAENILDVRDLNVTFRTAAGTVHAVRDVSFSVGDGDREILMPDDSPVRVRSLVEEDPAHRETLWAKNALSQTTHGFGECEVNDR